MTELMQMVIDKLGVKIGERFRLKGDDEEIDTNIYNFNGNGYFTNENGSICSMNLLNLMVGVCEIVKLPFKPQMDEEYKFVSTKGNIGTIPWYNESIDYYRFNAKNCFRPEEEITEEDKKRIVAEMKSKYETE